MGTVVKMGGEPPNDQNPAPAKSGKEAATILSSLPVSPQVLGIGAGVLVVLAIGLWFLFGRGGNESAGTPTPGPSAPAQVGTGGSTAPAPGGSLGAPASAPGGGSSSFSPPPAVTSNPGAPPPPAASSSGELPPAPSMSSGGGGGGDSSVRTWPANPPITGAPVFPNGHGGYDKADAKSPFRKLPSGEVIDLRDPPGKY